MLYAVYWWAVLLLIGVAFLPLSGCIFSRFRDHGWIFSKVIGLFLTAWLTWTLNVAGLLPFRQESAIACLAVCFAANWLVYLAVGRHRKSRPVLDTEEDEDEPLPGEEFVTDQDEEDEEPEDRMVRTAASPSEFSWLGEPGVRRLILTEEILLLGIMAAWLWIVGFRPGAYGTEKFMDYAFITSMSRSTTMPYEDPWYAGETVNYYYGGQYITAWLMKLTGTTAGLAYNVMRSLITACSFVLPFSLAYQLMYDRMNQDTAAHFSRILSVSERVSQSARRVPAEEDPEGTEGILTSARAAHRARRWKGSRAAQAAVRAKREADSVRAGSFLADADPGGEKHPARRGRAGARETLAARASVMRDPAGPASYGCGFLAGLAVAFCGTMHYFIYGIVKTVQAALTGTKYSYWFPDSTRYIGYNPDLPDKTIHEFPAYSSVLGDLHAHYINILFVVTVAAVAYAWAEKQDPRHRDRLPFLRPEVLLIGLMTGVFRWTNFWDFPIYFVVCGAILFFVNLRTYRGAALKFFAVTLSQAIVMFAVGWAGALPFTLSFWQISSQIGLTHSHTLIHQLLVLWGMPCAIYLWFALTILREQRHMRRTTRKMQWSDHPVALPDLTVLLFGLCAAGLVAMPEFIYVKDIYGGENYRANTMFKLTYQAFILFGIVMAYVLVRVLMVNRKRAFEEQFHVDARPDESLALLIDLTDDAARHLLQEEPRRTSLPQKPEENAREPVRRLYKKANRRRKARLTTAVACILMLCVLAGYTGTAISSWFGDIFDPSKRISSDASVFVAQSFPTDYRAIRWLTEHVDGQPTILEASGNSYTGCERVSVATGLPTVAGWYVHEWLWRNQLDDLNTRVADVRAIYTSNDEETVKKLIEKYQISYIYIGQTERDTYGTVNDSLLQKIGMVAFTDGTSTYIMKVDSLWNGK